LDRFRKRERVNLIVNRQGRIQNFLAGTRDFKEMVSMLPEILAEGAKHWKEMAIVIKFDQLQLVPSGGDSGPRRDQTAMKIFCHTSGSNFVR
jgi:hypothetical protein